MTMSWETSTPYTLNLYEENLSDENIIDLSSQSLSEVPHLQNNLVCVLYLQNNKLKLLPEDLFLLLPNLMWLDLRDNELTDIPITIKGHKSLTHLLMQNNKLISLPNELGTVKCLKVLQLSGNPLIYPPRDVINAGTAKILSFLLAMYEAENGSVLSDKTSASDIDKIINRARSYNSVLDEEKLQNHKTLSVQFSERDNYDSDEDYYSKIKGKCPKLHKSRTKTLPPHCQSSKYLKRPIISLEQVNEKMKQSYFQDIALKKHKDFVVKTEKILQGKKNVELLRNWRKTYRNKQSNLPLDPDSYKLTAKKFPYDTDPEYMTFLNREDIEKDLPNKYKKRLYRKAKPTVPRKRSNDVHLAMKIKQLFENLEALDLNRETMSPRTEQKILLGEIQKISEIKQKLMELSTTNTQSVTTD
ncbi:asporin-like [Danaus plexippus]|uniref:asporin-like n=1 Tax=Danaus plexippus TaxID=13037 RepID=UPI002AB0824A|nr:asporin-like [Danaus plexippus]